MTVAVIAVAPECKAVVNVLATVLLPTKPTDEQLVQIDQDLQGQINEPYVLITATPQFVESLKKDMVDG